ncbi:MAG: hypothetical protein AAF170_13785 [Bacteroidota bacterium]
MRLALSVGFVAGLALAGCATDTSETPPSPPLPSGIAHIATPAGPESGRPRLSATPDGGAILSWTQPASDQHLLRYAVWADTGWSAPRTADTGSDWFVNWADTPGVIELPNGQTVAHTLVRQPAGGYAYDVRARLSTDGATWSDPITPHTDGLAAEHGFVSVVPVGDRAGLVWLDGREQAGGHGHHSGSMTLRFATLGSNDALANEAVLDDKVCDCCPTAAVATPNGLVVAYRDRTDSEIRDISVVRQLEGGWTEPVTVHPDGWEINACPVNGPALASQGDRVALAWYTGADSVGVKLAVSEDGGATFGPPVPIDDGDPIGRVSVALLPSGDSVVGWLERVEDDAVFRVRRIGLTGDRIETLDVATVSSGRDSGIPRIVAVEGRVLAAWTHPSAAVPLQTAVVSLNR